MQLGELSYRWIFSIQPSSGLSRQHNDLLDKDATISAVYKTVYKIRYTSIISTSAVGNRVVVNKESLTRLQSFMIWIFHASARRWDEIFNYDGVTIWRGRAVKLLLLLLLLPATASILTFGQMVADNKELLSIFFW